jgi:hypothetical protein
MQLYRYFVIQSSESYCHNPLCCFSTSVYFCKHIFRYRLSLETFEYTLVPARSLLESVSRPWNVRLFVSESTAPRFVGRCPRSNTVFLHMHPEKYLREAGGCGGIWGLPVSECLHPAGTSSTLNPCVHINLRSARRTWNYQDRVKRKLKNERNLARVCNLNLTCSRRYEVCLEILILFTRT